MLVDRENRKRWELPVLALLAALAVLTAFGRPLLLGARLQDVFLHGLFLFGFVLLPGWCLARAVRPRGGDLLLDLGEGAVAGWVGSSLAFLLLHRFGLGGAIAFWPLASLLFACVARRRGASLAPGGLGPCTHVHAALLLLLVVVVLVRVVGEHPSEWWYRVAVDSSFHTGNIAALAREYHFENPRLAGVPFNYHGFAYAPTAAEHLVLGLPVEELYFRVANQTLPLLLLLQVFNAGRVLGGRTSIGLVAAALVMLHLDPGMLFAQWLGPRFAWFDGHSYLDFGVYTSPSTCAGLIALASLLLPLHRWLEEGRRGELAWMGLLVFHASGSKGSVAPVVLAGLAGACVVLRGRGPASRRACVALAVAGLAALPMTLALSAGENSYAGAMFRWLPWATVLDTPGYSALCASAEIDPSNPPGWLPWSLGPAWLLLFLGTSGVLGLAGAWVRRRALLPVELVLALSAAAGPVPAVLLSAPGDSQLFFAYSGALALAELAAGALVRRALPRALERAILVVFGAPFAVAVLVELGHRVYELGITLPAEPQALARQREAMSWMRTHLPPDAVLVVSRREMLYSVFTERACFDETELYTPRWAAAGWKAAAPGGAWRDPGRTLYPLRAALNDSALAAPLPTTLQAIRAAIGAARPLYVVHDRLRWTGRGTPTPHYVVDPAQAFPPVDPAVLRVEYANETVRVCAWVEPGGPR